MENKTSGGVQPSEKVVYLDNAATTACAPEVLAVMVEALSGACGNPSSHYSVGYEAKEFVDTGRAQVAKAINASQAEIFFTGCGSEADNWAVKGTAFTKARQNKKHLITSAFEHHAITDPPDRNFGIAVPRIHHIYIAGRELGILAAENAEQGDFTPVHRLVKHIERQRIVHVVAHVCFEDDADGFCGSDASGEEHGRRDQAENGF